MNRVIDLIGASQGHSSGQPLPTGFPRLVKLAGERIQRQLSDEQIARIRHQQVEAKEARQAIVQVLREHLEIYESNPDPAYLWPEDSLDSLQERIFAVLYGLGPIRDLLDAENEIEDLALNGSQELMLRDRSGWRPAPDSLLADLQLELPQLVSMFNQEIMRSGKQAGPLSPIVDGKLPGGHRLSMIVPPVIEEDPGLAVVIRKHQPVAFTMEDFLGNSMLPIEKPPPGASNYLAGWKIDALLSPAAAVFLELCVISGLNILLIGATGVGKTSFLSMLGGLIPASRRILVLEDTRELYLRGRGAPKNCIYLTTQSGGKEGGMKISMSELVRTALRQRPDHLVLGEARGGEIWDLLNAMQTGHGGNLTSLHANSTAELIQRIGFMVDQADTNTRLDASRLAQLVGTSFQLVISLFLDWQGRRYIGNVSAFTGGVSASGEPEMEQTFSGGPEKGFRLQLSRQDSCLQSYFRRNGLDFDQVVAAAQAEQAWLETR